MPILILIFLTSMLTGCFHTSQYQQPLAFSPQNSAKIYIMRSSKWYGSVLNAPVYVNNNYIGRVGINGYLVWNTLPGIVTVSTDAGVGNYAFNKKNLSAVVALDAKKGKNYYIELSFPNQVTLVTPGYELELMHEKQGESLLEHLKNKPVIKPQ